MRHNYKYALLIMMVLLATQVNAQGLEEAIGFDDNVTDVPINGLIALGMAVASYLGYKKFKK